MKLKDYETNQNSKVIQKVCEEGEGWSWHDKKVTYDVGKPIDIDVSTLQYLCDELAKLERAYDDQPIRNKGEEELKELVKEK